MLLAALAHPVVGLTPGPPMVGQVPSLRMGADHVRGH